MTNLHLGFRLSQFISKSSKTAYVEEQSKLHTDIFLKMWDRVSPIMKLPKLSRVLDVGTGSGFAMTSFFGSRLEAFGLSVLESEVKAINERWPGRCFLADMHEIGMFHNFWDLIWMRHVLEHSVAPAFVLQEAHEALKDGGWIYVECPGPNTACGHDFRNSSHYSVMGRQMWSTLIQRAGFKIGDQATVSFETMAGPDEYYSFLGHKVSG